MKPRRTLSCRTSRVMAMATTPSDKARQALHARQVFAGRCGGEAPSSTLLGLDDWRALAVLSRRDPSGDRGGPAPAAGFHRGDARRAGAEGPAGGRRAVRARAAGRTGSASRWCRWRSGWGSIISGCSSSSRPRPGITPRCGGMWRAGSRPGSRWRRWWSMTPASPRTGTASPCVARQYSGTLGKTANCQVGVSVHLVNEGASCAADWRLFCPESWDDQALDDPVAAAAGAAPPRAGRHPRSRCATARSGGWRWR